jgi:hypothetical protein
LKRILDQNEQALGLFYLHPDTAIKIAVPSVALLQVSIAVRAEEHYEKLMLSREGRLSVEFQSKLGWLIGNLFSRVATPDWPHEELNELMSKFLGINSFTDKTPRWIQEENIKLARKLNIDISNLENSQIISMLEGCKPVPKIEQAINRVQTVLQDVVTSINKEDVEKIVGRLRNDGNFEAIFK